MMDKTRTSLEKWNAAIEILSAAPCNAVQLAYAIGVTHKVAWTMLRKLREAIALTESARKLQGNIYAGVWALAPKYIWMFLPDRYYRKERVISLYSSTDPSGTPVLKIESVSSENLIDGMKQLSNEGKRRLRTNVASAADSSLIWLNKRQMMQSPLMERLKDMRRWLNEQYNGIGTKSLPHYLHEFCFRWNLAARKASPHDEWYGLCFPCSPQ
ncbi:hypothetical protein MO973_12525 [Paenibacillus sp. TRM 82003]|nr:hypothetical protein [Paenibacillus sp. TRM 82003]